MTIRRGSKELCRRLVELALGEPIEEVELVETQHESKELTRPGGAYLDVLARTAAGELVDVEMQATPRSDTAKRARLYSARLTKEAWSEHVEVAEERTYDYSELPRVAVVFVCDFDPLGKGLRRYTGRTVYDGSSDTDDGSVAVFLNARGSRGDLDPDLGAFLDYVAGRSVEPGSCAFVDDINAAVVRANEDPEFLEGVMQIDEKLWMSKQEGKEEGKAEGLAEGKAAGAADQRHRISQLAKRMAADGRENALVATLTDERLLDEELRRYGIG